jgi:hypothetical protein
MHRVAWYGTLLLSLLGPLCALFLVVACFSSVLFRDEQFAYRDAATFYYPLYLRVQQEWSAGRWPLWDPGQNAGVPLLGMTRAAVLYPGKLVYAWLPYPWAVRVYTILHFAIAWSGTFALGRTLRLSTTAAGLAAMSYAFGAPVLFQYCNIIHLVGAAWIPWGFLALEWLVGLERRGGLPALAFVLALQVLGGDPEAAYVTVVCGVAYALVRTAWDRPVPVRRRVRYGLLLVLVGWVGMTLGTAYAAPRIAMPDWLPPRAIVQAIGLGIVGLAIVWRWMHRGQRARLGPDLAALACASLLALTLAAAQLVPAWEYTAQTSRASDEQPARINGFSVEPYRLLEAVWPDVWGRFGPENRSWVQALPPAGERRLWTPSLYIGGLTLMLSAAGLGFSRGARDGRAPPWRTWLSLVAIGAVAAGFGRFGGPLWVARWLPGVSALLGPHDPPPPLDRADEFLHDGAGSVYGLMGWVLPGFSWFRDPAKLLPFAAIALAVLAGLGWDRLSAGETRLPKRWCLAGLAVTPAALLLLSTAYGPILTWLTHQLPASSEFGPVDPRAALAATVRGLAHGGLVLGLGLVLCRLAPRVPRSAGAMALMGMALDLGIANAPLVWTLPQAEFETTPLALTLIKEARGDEESSAQGPFRVHRMRLATPAGRFRGTARERLRAGFAWQRDTLDSLSGLPRGFQYTICEGVPDRDDYVFFFGSEMAAPAGPARAASTPYLYSVPRGGYSLWNARYVIMRVSSNGWIGGNGSLERLYPPSEVVAGAEAARRWIAQQDWQLTRNRGAHPRAWLVHSVILRAPIAGRNDPGWLDLIKDLVYQTDPLWSEAGRPQFDLRAVAFVETDERRTLAGYTSRTPVGRDESVTITRYEPQHVELVAELKRPGLVILADAYDPGWSLTIDGAPAPIFRTNRLMRGAAVKAGRHKLVYTYNPASFRVGAGMSIAALLALIALVYRATKEGLTRPLDDASRPG